MTARTVSPLVLAALLALAGTSAFAQHNPKAAPAHPEEAASAPKASVDPVTGTLVDEAPPVPSKDGAVQHLVTEDSQVRIEETRVRGAAVKIVVHSKITGDSYEIQPRDNRLPPEQDKAAGMRTFSWGF